MTIEAKIYFLEHVKSGVQQGSVLVLLVFLAFINDVHFIIKVTARPFADDCILYSEVKKKNHQLQLRTVYERWKGGA